MYEIGDTVILTEQDDTYSIGIVEGITPDSFQNLYTIRLTDSTHYPTGTYEGHIYFAPESRLILKEKVDKNSDNIYRYLPLFLVVFLIISLAWSVWLGFSDSLINAPLRKEFALAWGMLTIWASIQGFIEWLEKKGDK